MVKPVYTKPTYIPSDPNQATLITGLRLSKVEQISVEAGTADDDEVKVVIEHARDYVGKYCVDHYVAKRDPQMRSVKLTKSFCPASSPSSKEKKPEVILYGADKTRWYSLQSLFLPDAKGGGRAYQWDAARMTAVTSDQDTMSLWNFANPAMDLLRRFWSLKPNDFLKTTGKNSEWQYFAQFLAPVERKLQRIIEREEQQPAVQLAGELLEKFYAQSPTPPRSQLEAVVESLKEWKKKMVPEVRTILFSEYPLLTEAYLDEAVKAVTEWLVRRILPQHLNTNLISWCAEGVGEFGDFKKRLRASLLDPNATLADIEELQLVYAVMDQVAKLPDKGPVNREGMADFFVSSKARFDSEVALPVLQQIVEEDLKEGEKEFVLRRIHALIKSGYLRGVKLTTERISSAMPFSWASAMKFDGGRTKEKVLDLKPVPKTPSEKMALSLVLQKIKGPFSDSKEPYLLTTPDAYIMLDDLQNLVNGETALAQAFVGSLLLRLLKLDEGPYLRMETEARQALILAVDRIPVTALDIEFELTPSLVEPAVAPVAEAAKRSEPEKTVGPVVVTGPAAKLAPAEAPPIPPIADLEPPPPIPRRLHFHCLQFQPRQKRKLHFIKKAGFGELPVAARRLWQAFFIFSLAVPNRQNRL